MGRSNRGNSFLDVLWEILKEAPFWVGPILAAGVYAGTRWGVLWIMQTASANNEIKLPDVHSPILVGLAPLFAGFILFFWIVAEIYKWAERLRARSDTSRSREIEPKPSPRVTSTTPQPESSPPACPLCGKEMVLRTAKKGPKPGEKFWGCPSYPNCRGTRNLG